MIEFQASLIVSQIRETVQQLVECRCQSQDTRNCKGENQVATWNGVRRRSRFADTRLRKARLGWLDEVESNTAQSRRIRDIVNNVLRSVEGVGRGVGRFQETQAVHHSVQWLTYAGDTRLSFCNMRDIAKQASIRVTKRCRKYQAESGQPKTRITSVW